MKCVSLCCYCVHSCSASPRLTRDEVGELHHSGAGAGDEEPGRSPSADDDVEQTWALCLQEDSGSSEVERGRGRGQDVPCKSCQHSMVLPFDPCTEPNFPIFVSSSGRHSISTLSEKT